MAYALYQTLTILLTIVWWVIIAQWILSLLVAFNVVNTSNDLVRSLYNALDKMTEPMYRPIRRVMPDFGMLDFSPVVVIIIIMILQRAVLPGIFGPLLASGT